jgi:hypothetical protein
MSGSLFADLPEGAHGIAVAIDRALRETGFYTEGWALEPPDSEERPDNFGLSHDGQLFYTVQVSEW